MNNTFIAHKRPSDGAEQLLINHLLNTADLAQEFAEQFNNGDYGYICGLLHDAGKYSKEFQKRIMEDGPKCDHSTAGAVIASETNNFSRIFSYCIAGHHCGLQDFGFFSDTGCEGTLSSRLSEEYLKNIPDYGSYKREISKDKLHLNTPPALNLPANRSLYGFSYYLFIKMLYSSLVDADYLDTEHFMNAGKIKRGNICELEELKKLLDLKLNSFQDSHDLLNIKRHEILRDCINSSSEKPGIFSLTVPTGGGKTLSSMAFALNHAIKYHKNRIIYVIPYTSIIEQNAKIFSDIFGENNILEHHSNYDFDSSENNIYDNKKLASENWDMPVIVTTNVQFFESVFSNKSSRNRKLHNVADSVIIFDEAQMLPLEYLCPCVNAICELVRNYKCTAVLCTATQPALNDMISEDVMPKEIAHDPKDLYETFKRVDVINKELMETDELVENILALDQCLTIVNTRKHALKIYSKLNSAGGKGIFHLSTLMCPRHRTAVINEIRSKLKKGESCRVVSTKLIEAGVDIDFPTVFRSQAGSDSIVQAAGRCNREGKLKDKNGSLLKGQVIVFKPEEEYYKNQPAGFRLPIEIAEMVQRNHPDIISLDAVEEYFKKLYYFRGPEGTDTKKISERIQKGMPKLAKSADDCFQYEFRQIAGDFKIIDEDSYGIIIPYDDDAKKLIAQLTYTEYIGAVLRKLQRYTVNIYHREYMNLSEAGLLENISENTAVLLDIKSYSRYTGLDISERKGSALYY